MPDLDQIDVTNGQASGPAGTYTVKTLNPLTTAFGAQTDVTAWDGVAAAPAMSIWRYIGAKVEAIRDKLVTGSIKVVAVDGENNPLITTSPNVGVATALTLSGSAEVLIAENINRFGGRVTVKSGNGISIGEFKTLAAGGATLTADNASYVLNAGDTELVPFGYTGAIQVLGPSGTKVGFTEFTQ